MDSKELTDLIAKYIINKKGGNIRILDLRELTPVTDFFVVCTASSEPQVKAIADYISDETKKIQERPWHSEGYQNLSWVLLDYVNVVVHIFLPEARKFYNLEGLWGDAKITEVKDE
ncbi:MAG TPA: ribosome silencing factor [Ignavibacteria bacterium]